MPFPERPSGQAPHRKYGARSRLKHSTPLTVKREEISEYQQDVAPLVVDCREIDVVFGLSLHILTLKHGGGFAWHGSGIHATPSPL